MDKSYSAETVLSQVHEGMTVYDSKTQNIGTVSDIYMGSDYHAELPNDAEIEPQADKSAITDGIMAAGNGLPIMPVPMGFGNVALGGVAGILPVFAFEDEIPVQIRSHLLEQGFIQIRGNGILGAARYVTADQVATVRDDAVYLNVSREQLAKHL